MKQLVGRWLCVVLLGLSAPAWAQQTKAPAGAGPAVAPRFAGKLSSDPVQFITDVQALMATTNNAAAKASAANLQTLWASNRLTATQQGQIVNIAQQMLAKKFKPRPHFESLFDLITAAKAKQPLSDAQTDELLSVLAKTVDKEDPRNTEKFLASVSQFLQTRYLYRSRYNSLRADGGSFSFAYNESDMPAFAAPPTPPAPAPKPKPAPAPVKAAATPAKAATKPAAKPVAKKKSSSGWDTSDVWDTGSGWGDSDDGWGTPVKKKAPAKISTAKAAPAAKAPEPEPEPEPEVATSSAYDSYMMPSTKGPVIVLKDVDLFMATAGDSITIRKTSGAVVPVQTHFVGGNGEYAWTANGSPATATLSSYDFDFSKPEFTAQPVTLSYPAVLESPVLGALSYKSVRKKPGTVDSGYPRFISLTNDARVKNIGDNIRYYGGFSLAGSRILSAALDGSLSHIIVEENGKPKFRAASRAYVLGDTVISATRAAVTIYEDKTDSLTHPGVKLKYAKGPQVLQLFREAGLYKDTPYFDSYHQMEIETELVTWPLHSQHIDFSMLTAKNQVTSNFESKEFYTNTRYQQIKSINKLHPLQMVVGYSQRHGDQKEMTVQEIAQELKIKEPNVRTAAAGLARDSYVQWKPETDEIVLLPKATHYVYSARGKKDYDHIAIKSLAPRGNSATLDLVSNDLLVRGVDRFNFSDDSVTVYVRPDSAIIRIQKNRNVLFNGTVVASAFVFKGQEFRFDYDGFYIDLAKIDSIIVKGKATNGSVMQARKESNFALTNKNKTSTGKLYINRPDNKSGRKKLGAYPSFDASTGAYVFFNTPEVLGGAYDTTMYFDIPPFKLDSLNNKNRSALGFKGTFVSGGIVPNFQTKLSLQDDGSLGFTYDVPKAGFPLYGGKGVLYNKVSMSTHGFQGNGNIKYLTGDFSSDQFIFYKDSVVTVGKSGVIGVGPLKGVEFAKVALQPGYQMMWAVKQDSMYLSTPQEGSAMRFYTGDYQFRGTVALTPGGLYGDGRLDGPQSFIRSTQFAFKPKSYSGKRSTLSIKSAEPNKPALVANEVAFEYDLQKAFADFTREDGSKASIDLPYSDYRTTLSGGRWDFQKKMVQMRVAPGADSSRSYFYSTKPDQNGLKFRASTGQYDLSRYRLVAGGVPHIATADAWIEPDSNKVYVLGNAQMRAFQNAGIVMDTLAKFHNLYKGAITIQSRNAFSGNAMYHYRTAADSFNIKFSNFHVDSTAMRGALASTGKVGGPRSLFRSKNMTSGDPNSPSTIAVGAIKAEDKFHLAPRVAYRGSMIMNSQRKGFTFDGQSRLEFLKDPTAADWFTVKDSIDPKGVEIRLIDPKTQEGTPLLAGLFVSESTNKLYPLFVAAKTDAADMNLFTVDGALRYDNKLRDFTISRHDPANPDIYEGSVLTFDDSTASMNFRGKLNLITSNKDYSLLASGLGYAKPDSNIYKLDTFLAFDINVPEKALAAMGDDLAKMAKMAPPALDASREELFKVGELAGSNVAQDYANRKGNNVSLQRMSSKLMHGIVLNKVNLVWAEKQRAWYSVGKIGLASVLKTDINALIDGYIEIRKEANLDIVELYLEADPQTWYYFKYANNLLLTKAQHGSYDELVAQKVKGDYNTATSYGAYVGYDTDVDQFINHFRKDFLGETGKRKVVAAPVSTGNFDFMEDNGKKKKKKKGQDDTVDEVAPAAATAPPAEDTGKKKKAKDEAPTQAADAAPAEDTGKKKKKDKEVTEAPANAPAADDSKKKKKKKAPDDPFGED